MQTLPRLDNKMTFEQDSLLSWVMSRGGSTRDWPGPTWSRSEDASELMGVPTGWTRMSACCTVKPAAATAADTSYITCKLVRLQLVDQAITCTMHPEGHTGNHHVAILVSCRPLHALAHESQNCRTGLAGGCPGSQMHGSHNRLPC